MGSLNKKKILKIIKLWLKKNTCKNFIVSGKIDGISALRTADGFFSRGDGNKGCDLKPFLPFLIFPKNSPNTI